MGSPFRPPAVPQRPGQRTAEYIDRILARLTLVGALYVSAVCVLPSILISRFNVPFYFGGTALLIVVGVARTRSRLSRCIGTATTPWRNSCAPVR